MKKMIDNPEHYTHGKIEVKDFIADQKLNFFMGNVVKYICRADHKGTPLDDLMKAQKYIEFEIEERRKNG